MTLFETSGLFTKPECRKEAEFMRDPAVEEMK
jgi:hypothetical protein